MHFFIHIGRRFSVNISHAFVFETDFTQAIFVRLPLVGQFWKTRGWQGTFDPWSKVRGTALEAMPFIP